MSEFYVPNGYLSKLSVYETQTAIGFCRRVFEDKLGEALNLKRVSAPLFVEPQTGLNDDLNGVERPVEFDILEMKSTAQIVHSLAKWKRAALKEYGFKPGEGIYTDMNAIRRDEATDNIHSIYVDQWDWERVITAEERNEEFLKDIAGRIVGAMADTGDELRARFPGVNAKVSRDIGFVTTYELEEAYPGLTPKEREDAYAKERGTAFIMQIGGKLASGGKHDGRAPDYDDWKLNGDILFWDDLLGRAIEISSMGIRVDEKSLDYQLTEAKCDHRRALPFHKRLLAGELPLTIGGGIGQSRLCMYLMEKAHIGEVQVSVWDKATRKRAEEAGIKLL